MTVPLAVVGAGGFGRETLDVIEASNEAGTGPAFDVVGVVDDHPSEANIRLLARRGVDFLGTVADWLASSPSARYVIGIGRPQIKRQIYNRLSDAGLCAATLRHPASTVGAEVVIGEGAIICAGVRLTNNTQLGKHAHLNLNVTVGHDCVIGDFSSINPLAAISGDCTVGSEVMVGTGSVILQGLSVGDAAIVGASACVVRNVPARTTVKGIPAK